MLPVETPFKTYTGIDGKPLDNGYVYIGLPSQDPIAHPVTVYWDAAGTTPAAQPLRTVNGYIVNDASAPANVYYNAPYSELVKDSKGRQVCYAQNSDDFSIGSLVSGLAGSGGANKVGFMQAGANSVARTMQAKGRDRVSLKDKGAKGDGLTDDTAAVEAARSDAQGFEIPSGAYSINNFRTLPNHTYIGIDNPVIAFHFVSAVAWLGFQSGSRYEGITFQSNEANLPNQRGAIDDATNVTIRDCNFYGFRDADPLPNAWGVLIQRSSNVVLDCCGFANNSQADIAITDNCRDITIINAWNIINGGVKFNLEPNTTNGLVGANIIGGHYREMWLQEVDNTAYANRGIVVSGARVDTLYYDGAGAEFINCDIGALANAPDGIGRVYAGALRIDTIDLHQNLITDERLWDVGASDGVAYWAVYATGTAPWTQAFKDPTYGRFIRINPGKTGQTVQPVMRDYITGITGGEQFIVYMHARVDNTGQAGVSPNNLSILWYDAADNLVRTDLVVTCRTAGGTFSPWCDDVALVVAPATASKCKIAVGPDPFRLMDITAVGMFRFSLNARRRGNMNAVLDALAAPNTGKTFYRSTVPAGTNNYAGYFVAERCINSAPAVGQPKAWTCTADGVGGDAGTWVSEGNL